MPARTMLSVNFTELLAATAPSKPQFPELLQLALLPRST
jgi:hypothetical protein